MAKEVTVEEKLRALYDLQLIDSRIDRIRNIRGELPLEVEDLEDEIGGLETRMEKLNTDLKEFDLEVKAKKNLIKESEEKISKYETQQKNVRNNREFDALSKEIEFQELEIQLAEKRIREFKAKMDTKKEAVAQATEKLTERKSHLEFKKSELDNILKETQDEEELLISESKKQQGLIEERLLFAYTRLRNSARNGLAVVPVERGASGGSFFTIPPQRQLEIAARKKIISDEHSGRILVDPELAREEEEKMQKLFSSAKKK
tara:strand:+ start:209255 stop:210037 length:783 start_codon:yes stop_codon:yes gene_type:complete